MPSDSTQKLAEVRFADVGCNRASLWHALTRYIIGITALNLMAVTKNLPYLSILVVVQNIKSKKQNVFKS